MAEAQDSGLDMDLKSRKEAFVTGHAGSDRPWEVLWVCSSVLWGCWLYAELLLLLTRQRSGTTAMSQKLLLEALVVWLPIVVAQTHYLYPYGSLMMAGQIVVALSLLWKRTTKSKNENESESEPESESSINIPHTASLDYLTLYRSSIYFLTFVAILAVDFPLFPRRFCKTEVEGYGLMDVGAASFVFSSGIVSGKAYTKSSKMSNIGIGIGIWRPLLKAAPLIAIGVIRCLLNKEIEYQEHVTEYGVHWNFFFTLGVLAVVPTLRRQILTTRKQNLPEFVERWIVWAPALALCLYQYELVATKDDPMGLKMFLLTAPRIPDPSVWDNVASSSLLERLQAVWMRFFFANREGILGCIGYTFLHAAGEYVGQHYVFVTDNSNGDSNGDDNSGGDESASSSASSSSSTSSRSAAVAAYWATSLGKLVAYAWITLYSSKICLPMASRRETNLSFCLWAIAHNLTILWGFQIIVRWTTLAPTQSPTQSQSTGDPTKNKNATTSAITSIVGPAFGAVNRHGMISFLVANLLTGLVNLLIPTIDTSDALAMGILVIYLSAVGGVALLMDYSRNYKKSNTNDDETSLAATKKTN